MKAPATLLLTGLLAAGTSFAGVIVPTVESPVAGNVGGYTMTEFFMPSPVGSYATSATSLNGDVVNFTGKNGAALSNGMTVGDKSAQTWWSGSSDQFYYASFSDLNWVELIMPANTFAFSLTIDASTNANAWILGVDQDGNAVNTAGTQYQLQGDGNFYPEPDFNIQLRRGASQTFGFYADNSNGGCSTISKVVIDPTFWGMGDFSINTNANGCAEVPEPGSMPLIIIGLLGVVAARVMARDLQ